MKKKAFVGLLILFVWVFHSLIPKQGSAEENSIAVQVFEKHNETLSQRDVENLLPSVLKAFKELDTKTVLTQDNLSRAVANPESLKELLPKVDVEFIPLLTENEGIQAIFKDPDFHILLQDDEAIAELARLIKASWLELQMGKLAWFLLLPIIAVLLYTLGKGADWLVDEAVLLSTRWGLGKAVIGATIVSIGTTTPEAAVSVLSAIQGKPGLALGNAVGSIICDTGLIIGLASLIAPLSFNRQLASRLSNVQVSAGILLVLACIPWSSPAKVFAKDGGGLLPQFVGFIFVLLLGLYIWQSIRWAGSTPTESENGHPTDEDSSNSLLTLLKLIGSIAVVVISAQILIPAVSVLAIRFKVPESIISLTLVAFGTSLPELVTAITAVRRGHGELAVGNIIGADILNVLFVAGVSAAATKGGLIAEPHFFQFAFPAMVFILIVFRIGIHVSGNQLKRPFGIVLVAVWIAVLILSILLGVDIH